MSWATSEVVTVLAFLLPGLVSVIVFYALTSHPKPSELERIVQALAFTIASQVISSVAVHIFDFDQTADEWPEFSVVVLPFCISVILALIAATATNHDFPHSLLRACLQSLQNEYSEGENHHLQAGIELSLAVLPETAALLQPGERPLHHPSFRQHHECVQPVALDHLHPRLPAGSPPPQQRASRCNPRPPSRSAPRFRSPRRWPNIRQGPGTVSNVGGGHVNRMG